MSTEEPMSTEQPMSIEDRVRTATRAGATLVTDIRPLAEPERVRSRRRPAPAARRWRAWGIPLAAAAAVVLVALSVVAVRQFGASAPSTGGPATNGPTPVPRYYVALDESVVGYTGSWGLIVGDDLTGETIATIKPPRGLVFADVQGASDDRTFIVQAIGKNAEDGLPETWYLLRIAPGTARPYLLTKLPIKLPSSSPDGLAYALSPDDRELAVESESANPSGGITLGIYSVSSGARLRAWTTDVNVESGPAQETLSWFSGGRQLAFSVILLKPERNQLRTLDVTGSGTGLMTASRAVVTVPLSGAGSCYSLHITPDGGTVICATQYAFLTGSGTNAGCANGGLEFTAYSARTGRLIRVLYRYRGACANGISTLHWTDDSASEIIGATQTDMENQGGKQTGQVGVISDGRIRLLKLSKSVSLVNYGTVAF